MLNTLFSVILVIFLWRLFRYFYYRNLPIQNEPIDYERAYLRYYFLQLFYRQPTEEELDHIQKHKDVWFK